MILQFLVKDRRYRHTVKPSSVLAGRNMGQTSLSSVLLRDLKYVWRGSLKKKKNRVKEMEQSCYEKHVKSLLGTAHVQRFEEIL